MLSCFLCSAVPTHLWHVEVVHKDDHAFALRGSHHPTPALVQFPVDDVLSHVG